MVLKGFSGFSVSGPAVERVHVLQDPAGLHRKIQCFFFNPFRTSELVMINVDSFVTHRNLNPLQIFKNIFY